MNCENYPKEGLIVKLTKANPEPLILAGKPWRLGPKWPGRRCLAKTRSGGQCQCPAMKGKARCRIHGGLSTGPRTNDGKEKARQAVLKHGHYTKAAIENRQRIVREIADIEAWTRAQGFNLDF